MREQMILKLKQDILSNNVEFLDIICNILEKNKIIYTDNYGKLSRTEVEAIELLEPFIHLLYRGSKHSVGNIAESGFNRIVVYKGKNLKLTYYNGPDTFVTVEEIKDIKGIKPIVTIELLRERLQEAENVKNELAPIIEKYIKAGLTFEEITRMFVEIMRENRIHLK